MWERERRKHTIQGGESVCPWRVRSASTPRRPAEGVQGDRPVNSVDRVSRLQCNRDTTLSVTVQLCVTRGTSRGSTPNAHQPQHGLTVDARVTEMRGEEQPGVADRA